MAHVTTATPARASERSVALPLRPLSPSFPQRCSFPPSWSRSASVRRRGSEICAGPGRLPPHRTRSDPRRL